MGTRTASAPVLGQFKDRIACGTFEPLAIVNQKGDIRKRASVEQSVPLFASEEQLGTCADTSGQAGPPKVTVLHVRLHLTLTGSPGSGSRRCFRCSCRLAETRAASAATPGQKRGSVPVKPNPEPQNAQKTFKTPKQQNFYRSKCRFWCLCHIFSWNFCRGSNPASVAQRAPNEARWLIAGSAGKGRKTPLITKWFSPNPGRTDENKYTCPKNFKNPTKSFALKRLQVVQREPEPTQVRLVVFHTAALGPDQEGWGRGPRRRR